MISSAPPHGATCFVQCDNLFGFFFLGPPKGTEDPCPGISTGPTAACFAGPSGNKSGSVHDDKLVSNKKSRIGVPKPMHVQSLKALLCT